MPSSQHQRRIRQRGEITQLPSGSYRIRVYASRDPITRRRHHLQEIVRKGPVDAPAELPPGDPVTDVLLDRVAIGQVCTTIRIL
ncbi:hypothetical protein ACQP04_07025 [Pseudonocardia halophobica]|uniref:hypothetical protein n=1 Tax=Pseudonocardia halophobica TaxID=29401 RepID=UPI003D942B15